MTDDEKLGILEHHENDAWGEIDTVDFIRVEEVQVNLGIIERCQRIRKAIPDRVRYANESPHRAGV